MKQILRAVTCLALLLVSGTLRARAAELPRPVPPFRAAEDTLPLNVRDDAGLQVALRVPRSLCREANSFRLYGVRPLTLRSRDRRRDLYRDAFLELATRSHLTPAATLWDPLSRQLTWFGTQSVRVPGVADPIPVLPGGARDRAEEFSRWTAELGKKLEGASGYGQWTALTRALTGHALGKAGTLLELSGPVLSTLQLRALATDRAEQRLLLAGRALRLDQPGTDPAMRAGYQAALAEFAGVRQGLWPALAASLEKNQGQLLLSAVKGIALSPLGIWAIFGELAWQGAESTINAEYNGQLSVCFGTLACNLEEAARGGAEPELTGESLYVEFVMNRQLHETFQDGQLLPLKPAGGRTAGAWQIQFTSRCDELKNCLNAG